jgi:hypothetical protein
LPYHDNLQVVITITIKSKQESMLFCFAGGGAPINPQHRQLFTTDRSRHKRSKPCLESLVNSFYGSCTNACAFEYANLQGPLQQAIPAEDSNVTCEVTVTSSAIVPSPLLDIAKNFSSAAEFITALPVYTAAEVQALQEATSRQRKCELWRLQRAGRITASEIHSVMTRVRTLSARPGMNHDVSVLLNRLTGKSSVNENIPAIKYGLTTEEEAR